MESTDDLPYRAEYAKSGRASCKGCKDNIAKESLRLATMVASPFFDGKQPKWYHYACFFTKQKPASVADIAHFEALRFDDQEKIRAKISSCSGVAGDAGAGKKGSKAASKDALKDYLVEYSKSGGAKCRVCEQKVLKGEVRLGQRVYDSERARAYGAYMGWHHVECFVKNRHDIGFWDAATAFPGFKSLGKEDQQMLKKQLPKVDAPKRKAEDSVDGASNAKKSRSTEKNGDKNGTDGGKSGADETDARRKQNQLMFRYRDRLKQLSRAEQQLLLEENEQYVATGEERRLDLLCDVMSFGALASCDMCGNGQLYFRSGVGYQCGGDLSEWTKCTNVVVQPERRKFIVPDSLKTEYPFLNSYKCKISHRILADLGERTAQKEAGKRERVLSATPLQGLKFVLSGGVADDTSTALRRMGATIVKRVTDKVAALVCTQDEFDADHALVVSARKHDVHVISDTIAAKLQAGTVFSTIDLNSLITVNTKLAERLGTTEQQMLDERRQSSVASGSSRRGGRSDKRLASMSGGHRKVLSVDGAEVDPDSEMAHVADVHRDKHGHPMSAVLCMVDAGSGLNSYYRLQLLVKRGGGGSGGCWLFRAWGRLGTSVGGQQLLDMDTVIDGEMKFTALYEEKTGNQWWRREHFKKLPSRFYPMDLDYGQSKQAEQQLSAASSKSTLPPAVITLVCAIFDMNTMRRTMLEFEIDMDKMPLGKISRDQMERALKVLTEAQNLVQSSDKSGGDCSKQRQGFILDCSNRFFTLVPHNFGMKKPPLLDNLSVIKEKLELVTNLMDIELAFSIHQSSSGSAGGVDAVDAHYLRLKSDITVLPPDSPQFMLLQQYVQNTHAATHSGYKLVIEQIFCVSRQGESARYKPFSRLPNRKLLWHGSRITNFAGILSQGLRIAPPEAPVTGYMFGKGIYFADMVSKSANYCCASPANPHGLLLLCEVALGNMYECRRAEYVTKLPTGKHSTMGQGKTHPNPSQSHFTDSKVEIPLGPAVSSSAKDSSLLYNEYIIYDVSQCRVQYLFYMRFDYN